MGKLWIKLWHDSLHDTKLALLPEYLQLRFIKLLLIAGDFDKSGLLPPVESMAYDLGLLRDGVAKTAETLAALQQVGVVDETPGGWVIVNWEKRQARSESYERVRRFREKQKDGRYSNGYSNVTHSVSASASESGSDSSLLKPGEESKDLGGEDFRFYEQEIGILTPMIADSIQEAETEYPQGWIQMAIAEAAAHNKRSWKYCEAILKRWKVEGLQSRKGRDNGSKPAGGTSNLPSAFEAWENLCGAWVGEKSEAEMVDEKIFINKILYTWLHPEVERIGRMLGWPKEFPNPKNMSTDRAHFVKAWEQGARDG